MPRKKRIKSISQQVMTTLFTLLEILGIPKVPNRPEAKREDSRV